MNNQGFTILEVTIIGVMVAILSAVSAPNLLQSKYKQELVNDHKQLRLYVVEAIANMNRKSRDCTITIPAGVGVEITNDNNCTLEGLILHDHVEVASTVVLPYAFTGVLPSEQMVIISSSKVPDQYCITFGLLHIRSGAWENGTCNNLENLKYR
jgi:type II secretory pathway pseudopilin PulG